MKTALKVMAICGLAVSLGACGNAKDANKTNFKKAIQAYLGEQNGVCFSVPTGKLPFTIAVDDLGSAARQRSADGLVAAGLVTASNSEIPGGWFREKMIAAKEYASTELGKKYLVDTSKSKLIHGAAFCSGKYSNVQVGSFSEPSDMNGFKISRVHFTYRAEELAEWASNVQLMAADSNFAREIDGEIAAQAVFVLTDEGWVHERMFKR